MGTIIVGGVVKKDGKYLLVQEAKEICRGKWNVPAGHLEVNETIIEGAKREIKEECGYNVTLTGIATIGNRVLSDNLWLSVVFSTEIVSGEIKYNKEEILDAKWFSCKEILNMREELRNYDLITNSIRAVEENKTSNIDLVCIVK